VYCNECGTIIYNDGIADGISEEELKKIYDEVISAKNAISG